jgi:DNA-binding beta-propeller fold protein YncE
VAGDANGHAGSNMSQFNETFGIAVDSSDNIYVADRYNDRVQLWLNNALSGSTIARVSGNIMIVSK